MTETPIVTGRHEEHGLGGFDQHVSSNEDESIDRALAAAQQQMREGLRSSAANLDRVAENRKFASVTV